MTEGSGGDGVIYEVTCYRANEIRISDPRTGEIRVHQTSVFLDSGDVGDEYQAIEGSFSPSPFEAGKRYRITVAEIEAEKAG